MHVVLLTNMITPYRIPLFHAIAERSGTRLTILLETKREKDRQWQVLYENLDFCTVILSGLCFNLPGVELHINLGVSSVLRNSSPDVIIIGGFSSVTAWMALLWARINRVPIVLWSGSTLLSSRYLHGPIAWLRKLFVRNVDAYVTYGSKAAEALVRHGASPDRIAIGCNVGDIVFFRNAVSQYRLNMPMQLRQVHTTTRLLYVGQLIPRKGLFQLLSALKELIELDWELTIIGDGPLHRELQNYVNNNLAGRVQFEGFHQTEGLIPYLSNCDVLTIPSLVEVGSIVMSEGIASGLFVLASVYDGSTYNLIREPINGVVVDPKQHHDMVSKLRWILLERPWQGRRDQIADSIQNFTPDHYADAFLSAIQQASRRFGNDDS